ncbi:hypothetical protein [Flavobacterium sp. W20_MBD1_R3]|uniref:hypothetical protein n=1 Tax=Flavobacterium sp. W20_MBD1_R3 TaxID=3240278 RepID=UPI003F8F85C2
MKALNKQDSIELVAKKIGVAGHLNLITEDRGYRGFLVGFFCRKTSNYQKQNPNREIQTSNSSIAAPEDSKTESLNLLLGVAIYTNK